MIQSSRRRLSIVLAVLGLAGCADGGVEAPETLSPAVVDEHSFARPLEARVRHVSLDLRPDFQSRRLAGTARLVVARATGADSIILDVRDLSIDGVTDAGGDSLAFRLGTADSVRGTPLIVTLPEQGDTLVIRYATSPEAGALQWLAPAQTAGGRLPFLFTQGQAILTRTWVPTQDSPGIRQTYDAVIHVPAGMRAVMSAELLTPEGEAGPEGLTSFRFRMNEAIPPYLFALAVGDLEFRAIGEETGVWAEPSVVASAASEFAEVDEMIEAAERLYGPYRWGRYDILVLPPSFPFGGMENPRLTFATPTVLAGDRSLVALIAHELAHSWSGNLVTNATWDDFWLNEGFTTYLEGRIMEELRGKEYADMLRQLGRQSLLATIEELGGAQAPDTRLQLDLSGRNPDDGMTDVAYEKGAAFLQTVEAAVGREALDTFLRAYFDRFAFQPMTSERFLEHMNAELFRGDETLAARVRAEEWIYQPGLPDNAPPARAEAFDVVDQQVAAFRTGTAPAQLQTADWTTHEWLHFLRALPDTLSAARLDALDAAFGLSRSGNSEILFEWLRIAIANRYEPAFPALDRFLTAQGRRKFLAPLYTDLAATPWGATMARDIYRRARPTYHAVAVNTIDDILDWPGR